MIDGEITQQTDGEAMSTVSHCHPQTQYNKVRFLSGSFSSFFKSLVDFHQMRGKTAVHHKSTILSHDDFPKWKFFKKKKEIYLFKNNSFYSGDLREVSSSL